MEKTELLHAHNFENTVITKLCCNAFEGRSERYCTMTIQGNFGDEEKEYRHYNLYFIRSQDLLPTEELQTLTNPVLRKINVVKTDQTYHAKLEISSDSQTISLDFHCSFDVGRSHYRGFDYTNIYETKEFDAWADHFRYAESPEYFQNESTISLPDGYSLLCKEYLHQTEHTVRACFSRYTLQKGCMNSLPLRGTTIPFRNGSITETDTATIRSTFRSTASAIWMSIRWRSSTIYREAMTMTTALPMASRSL